MKHVIIAPAGPYMDDLYVGIKEFPTERVIILTDNETEAAAQKAKEGLEKFKVPVQIRKLPESGHVWEKTFEAIAEIKKQEKDKHLLVNVSTGSRDTRCAATSAAFVNGIRAFSIDNDIAMLLPILKFSYYKALTEKKLAILKIIKENDSTSLEELHKKTGMSLPLISYHLHGTSQSEGLKELGLIETEEKKGKVSVKLTPMARLLLKGYIENPK